MNPSLERDSYTLTPGWTITTGLRPEKTDCVFEHVKKTPGVQSLDQPSTYIIKHVSSDFEMTPVKFGNFVLTLLSYMYWTKFMRT